MERMQTSGVRCWGVQRAGPLPAHPSLRQGRLTFPSRACPWRLGKPGCAPACLPPDLERYLHPAHPWHGAESSDDQVLFIHIPMAHHQERVNVPFHPAGRSMYVDLAAVPN